MLDTEPEIQEENGAKELPPIDGNVKFENATLHTTVIVKMC